MGSSQLEKVLELAHWLIRLRLVNECLVLNNTDLALIMAAKGPNDYGQLKAGLPPWTLFFNIAAYDYLPETRIRGQIKDMEELAQRLVVEPVKVMGDITADAFFEKDSTFCPGTILENTV